MISLNSAIDYENPSGLAKCLWHQWCSCRFTHYSADVERQHILFSVYQVLLLCKDKVLFISDQWLYSSFPTISVMQSHAVCAWATPIKCVMTQWLSAILKCEYCYFYPLFSMSSSLPSPSLLVSCSHHNIFSLQAWIAHAGDHVHLIIKWWLCGDTVRVRRENA